MNSEKELTKELKELLEDKYLKGNDRKTIEDISKRARTERGVSLHDILYLSWYGIKAKRKN